MAFIFRYNLILNKTDLKHCDKKSVENDEPLELNMFFFSFFFKTLPRREQFPCDTEKLSMNSENRIQSPLPCKLNVFIVLYMFITVLLDLNLNRKHIF